MALWTKLRSWLDELLPAKPVRQEAGDQEQFHTWMHHLRQRQEDYQQMTTDELKALPDNELIQAVQLRAERHVDGFGMERAEQLAGFLDLSEPQRTVCTLYWYENEILNGGLSQFFVNSSRMVAPYVSSSLNAVGAEEHRELFDGFIRKHEIDLDDLASFASEEEETEKYDRYPFEEFDEAFYELETLERFVVDYIKENIEEV